MQLARASRLPSVGLLVGGGFSGDWLNLPVLNGTPRLDINGNPVALPGVNAPGSASGSFYDWGAAISLRQPLFDGGQSRAATELAQRRAEQGELAIEQARQAVLDGADYIGVGPVFPTRTKQFAQFAGLAFVSQVAAEISLPAYAIGGIGWHTNSLLFLLSSLGASQQE